ncbi:hypothetical protein CLV97_1562 [Planifilum fimeticola]|uniref:DNA methylase n=2 Tax=Planifilum fimeticola TaxID=201975 RepID=A0A2T0L9U4_9BACL|nr:hypothetical protein CLV97_1562 [Planifilum fimeticola]
MAQSPTHKFGQIIGELLEAAIEPLLADFAKRHGLYLDKKGPRPARGTQKKVSWTDLYGNTHDLDFVLERGGTKDKFGTPVAFIESAWRRYTKHSRNKAQEIQGAILPLVQTHHLAAPFTGVILAGDFTDGSLTQLQSLGFKILYFPYDMVVEAFKAVGIDASFDENTSDEEVLKKVRAWEALPKSAHKEVCKVLFEKNKDEVQQFMYNLERFATRYIELVHILPLHGEAVECESVEQAVQFIQKYDKSGSSAPIVKYEIRIRYNNGDKIEAQFESKESAIQFLRSYQQPTLRPSHCSEN